MDQSTDILDSALSNAERDWHTLPVFSVRMAGDLPTYLDERIAEVRTQCQNAKVDGIWQR